MAELFEIKADIAETVTRLENAPKAVKWAYVIGATRTAKIMAKALKDEMPKAFDRPTPFAIRGISWKGATFDTPVAKIGFGLSAMENYHLDWAQAEVHGGNRPLKAMEKAISAKIGDGRNWYVLPGKAARLDRYGNISGGQIQQVLSDLGVQRDVYQNATGDSRKRNRRSRYFVLYRGEVPIGIALRKSKKQMEIAFALTRKAPAYKPALGMMAVARRVTDEVFPTEVAKAFRI